MTSKPKQVDKSVPLKEGKHPQAPQSHYLGSTGHDVGPAPLFVTGSLFICALLIVVAFTVAEDVRGSIC